MRRKTNKILVIMMLLALWILVSQDVDIAKATDPDYPTKPIQFQIITTAGGSTDLQGRAITKAASIHLGQPIIPINNPGGGNSIAMMAVKTSKPDGYTIGITGISGTLMIPFSEGAPFKDLSGFSWICNFGTLVFPFIVRADAPWKTWQELIEWARAHPKGIKASITGPKKGDYKGFVLWQVEHHEKVVFDYLPFKGSPDALASILGGHNNLYAATIDTTTMSYINEGKLRLLAYAGQRKVPGYENVPSLYELYGIDFPDVATIYGPKGLPSYVTKKLGDAFEKGLKDPDFIEMMKRMYAPIVYRDGATQTKYMNDWFSKTAKTLAALNAEEAKEKK
jgi:tripartite-type tricarboxylate transporter receptor subunit TctC